MEKEQLTITKVAASVGEKSILTDVSLTVSVGEVHAIMGPNGSGKSTLAYATMGHPAYTITGGKVYIGKKNILDVPPEERARLGLFLAFQSPIGIPGVTVTNLLRTAYQEIHKDENAVTKTVSNPALARRWQGGGITIQEFTKQMKEYAAILHMDQRFFERGVHDGFSGGEKKKLEMLQALVLKPKFAFFDEIDTGLDVDALKIVAEGMKLLKQNGTGVIVITHYQRILKYITPDYVHILVNGKIVESGKAKLAKEIEKNGYASYVPVNTTHH